jgi:hypothetical protein
MGFMMNNPLASTDGPVCPNCFFVNDFHSWDQDEWKTEFDCAKCSTKFIAETKYYWDSSPPIESVVVLPDGMGYDE